MDKSFTYSDYLAALRAVYMFCFCFPLSYLKFFSLQIEISKMCNKNETTHISEMKNIISPSDILYLTKDIERIFQYYPTICKQFDMCSKYLCMTGLSF